MMGAPPLSSPALGALLTPPPSPPALGALLTPTPSSPALGALPTPPLSSPALGVLSDPPLFLGRLRPLPTVIWTVIPPFSRALPLSLRPGARGYPIPSLPPYKAPSLTPTLHLPLALSLALYMAPSLLPGEGVLLNPTMESEIQKESGVKLKLN